MAERKRVDGGRKQRTPARRAQDEALQENAGNGGKEEGFEEDNAGRDQNIAQVTPANPKWDASVTKRPVL